MTTVANQGLPLDDRQSIQVVNNSSNPGQNKSQLTQYQLCQLALKALGEGKYNVAATHLKRLTADIEHNQNNHQTELLHAAQQICAVCEMFQDDAEMHKAAVEKSKSREQELRQILGVILEAALARPSHGSDQSFIEIKQSDTKAETQRAAGSGWMIRRLNQILGFKSTEKTIVADQEKGPTIAPKDQSSNELGTTQAENDYHKEDHNAVPDIEKESHKDAGPILSPGRKVRMEAKIVERSEPVDLSIYFFGQFKVFFKERAIAEWKGQKSQAIFKYLVINRHKAVTKEALMEQFWPNADPSAQRRNLHQAIYSLRKSLTPNRSEGPSILFENDRYAIDPQLSVWCDVEEFQQMVKRGNRYWQKGERTQAYSIFEMAETVYNGEFLTEDPYEEWSSWVRNQLQISFLEIANKLGEHYFETGRYSAAISINSKILELDRFDEKAHREIMRCYLAQGQSPLALRRYRMCSELFMQELELPLSPETIALFEA